MQGSALDTRSFTVEQKQTTSPWEADFICVSPYSPVENLHGPLLPQKQNQYCMAQKAVGLPGTGHVWWNKEGKQNVWLTHRALYTFAQPGGRGGGWLGRSRESEESHRALTKCPGTDKSDCKVRPFHINMINLTDSYQTNLWHSDYL